MHENFTKTFCQTKDKKPKKNYSSFAQNLNIFVEKEDFYVTRIFIGVFTFGFKRQQRYKPCNKHKHFAIAAFGIV